MKNSKIFLGGLVLVMMAATSLLLAHMKAHQRLGEPGVKTRPDAAGKNLEILMPVAAPGFPTSEILTNAETILTRLPPDTSYRVRIYKAEDDSWIQMTTVLMGSDRSSIHRPQICLTGQGWAIDGARSDRETIHLTRPQDYELPVNKLVATKQFPDPNGNLQNVSGIYVYWFVDADRMTANPTEWMLWWMPQDLLLHGLLERWAYISVFAPCPPGQENATYERMKKFIADTVPEFQLVPRAAK
jgi:Protein of unknown function (DUF3485)